MIVPKEKIRVLHLLDTLEIGGKERIAVNTANLLPRDQYKLYLGTTRREGELSRFLSNDVGRLMLCRKRSFSFRAISKLIKYIDKEKIQIVHAHNAAIFMAFLAALFRPEIKLVWHDHMTQSVDKKLDWLYPFIAFKIQAAIAVNKNIENWFLKLGIPSQKIYYLPNFSLLVHETGEKVQSLPGVEGEKIICVANLRPEKDHTTLIQAMAEVVKSAPEATLFLVGASHDKAYLDYLKKKIEELRLQKNIFLIGSQTNIFGFLKQCNIGVLSSQIEGFPLALLEYGMAGLATVATDVGQCSEVLDDGLAGFLVPPSRAGLLAGALLQLIKSESKRAEFGKKLCSRVKELYSSENFISRTQKIYARVLET